MAIILREEKFYEQLLTDTLKNNTSKFVVRKSIVINNEAQLSADYKIIKNLIFRGNVTFENFDIFCGLTFEECEFTAGISFSNIKASKYDERFNSHNCNLFFSNCIISSLSIVNNTSFDRGIYIFNDTVIRKLYIKNSTIGNGGINIKKSSVEELLDVSISHSDGFLIQESHIKANIRLESFETNSCSFIKSTFDKSIQIWNCTLKRLTFNDNVFENTISITASKISDMATLSGDEFKKEFTVKFVDDVKIGELNSLYIKEAKFISRLIIDGGGQSINQLTIPFTSKLDGVIKFINCNFQQINISGINHNASLFFKSVKFKMIAILDFNNHNSLTFSNCEGLAKSIFEIKDSDLGDTKFNDFSFKNFSEIKIDYSLLNNILTSNIDWFEDKQLNFENGNTIKGLRNKREIYSQLKNASLKQANNIQSLQFRAREMQAYRRELKKSDNYSLGDRLIMIVSKSNNYGLDWIKPVIIICCITVLIYPIFIVAVSNEISILPSCAKADWIFTLNEFYSYSSAIPQLLNPVRRLTDVFPNEKLSFAVYLLDILHRIILSIFIFQVIVAFRKFFNKI